MESARTEARAPKAAAGPKDAASQPPVAPTKTGPETGVGGQAAQKPAPAPPPAKIKAHPAAPEKAAQAGQPGGEKPPAATPSPPVPEPSPRPAPLPQEVAEARKALAEGRNAKALELFDRAVEQDPALAPRLARDRAGALLARAADLLEKNPDQALADLSLAVQLAPDWARGYLQAGRIQTRLNRMDQALVSYDKAVELDPGLAAAHFNRGYILLARKNYPEAVTAFSKVVELKSPFTADALVNLAVCRHRMGQEQAAIGDLQQALKVNPNHALALKYLERLQKAAGKP